MRWIRRLALIALFWPSTLWAEGLTIFAAASLKEPLDKIVADFPGSRVSYGGSGALARQVQRGAPADVIVLANTAWMDVLVAAEAVTAPVAFASNALVLVGQPGAPAVELTAADLTGALDGDRMAMGFVASVPAGIYGRQAFETLGLWEAVRPFVAEVENVRAALALAIRAEVPLAVVYASDTRVTPDLSVVARFPSDSHDPILYWAAAVSDTPTVHRFVAALTEDAAQMTLAAAGFCAVQGCPAP